MNAFIKENSEKTYNEKTALKKDNEDKLTY